MAVILEGKLADDRGGLTREVEAAVDKGICAMKVKVDLRFGLFERLSLGWDGLGKSGQAPLESGGGGGHLLGFEGGATAPSFQKSGTVF